MAALTPSSSVQQPTLSDMTMYEMNFSLLVEDTLKNIDLPEYRQIIVEVRKRGKNFYTEETEASKRIESTEAQIDFYSALHWLCPAILAAITSLAKNQASLVSQVVLIRADRWIENAPHTARLLSACFVSTDCLSRVAVGIE